MATRRAESALGLAAKRARYRGICARERCSLLAAFERGACPRRDPRKRGEVMARSEILRKIEELSEERERLLARERSHHVETGDHRGLVEIDHTLGVLWDLRRRELAGEYVGPDQDFLDRYVVSPGDDAPDDYTWAR